MIWEGRSGASTQGVVLVTEPWKRSWPMAILEPERLLFMTEAQLKVMPGIGKVAMSNIGAYRAKFLR